MFQDAANCESLVGVKLGQLKNDPRSVQENMALLLQNFDPTLTPNNSLEGANVGLLYG